MLSVTNGPFMLSVNMLYVIMLSVVMLECIGAITLIREKKEKKKKSLNKLERTLLPIF